MRENYEFIYRTFAFQRVVIWNKLLQIINIHVSCTRFKHLLKDFLLSNVITFRYDKCGFLLTFLPIKCPPHPLPYPYLLSHDMLGGVVREHSVKTPNADDCYFHMEILNVDIYKFVTCSMNIL